MNAAAHDLSLTGQIVALLIVLILIAIATVLTAAIWRISAWALGQGRPVRDTLAHMGWMGPVREKPRPADDLGPLMEPPVGDDAVNLACRPCNGEWMYRCTCTGDCGHKNCSYEFERGIAELLGRESGQA